MTTEEKDLWQINLPYACFGIEVEKDGFIMSAAPIGKWMIGRTLGEIKDFVHDKNGTISKVNT